MNATDELRERIRKHLASYEEAFDGCRRNSISISLDSLAIRDLLRATLALMAIVVPESTPE